METAGKTITCRAAVAWEPKKPLSIETIEVAPPKAGEVRLKLIATGVCHTDSFINNHMPESIFPLVLGHEGAGIVESVGEGVTSVAPGDHVIPLYNPQCGECRVCKHPDANMCIKFKETQNKFLLPDGTMRLSCKGKPLHHSMGVSTFSEYTVCADIAVVKIDPKAPMDKVCLLGCGVPTGYGAALNSAKVTPGSTCAVWGLGGIGLAAVMGCKKAGASKIYGIDINPDKFELAKKFGATDFINPKDYPDKTIQEVVKALPDGGFDFTFECIGTPETIKAAFDCCVEGYGLCISIGVTEKDVSIHPLSLIHGRTLRGTYFGGYKAEQVPSLVDQYMKKELMLDEFVTFTLPLDKINDAFKYMHEGKSIRSVIIF